MGLGRAAVCQGRAAALLTSLTFIPKAEVIEEPLCILRKAHCLPCRECGN